MRASYFLLSVLSVFLISCESKINAPQKSENGANPNPNSISTENKENEVVKLEDDKTHADYEAINKQTGLTENEMVKACELAINKLDKDATISSMDGSFIGEDVIKLTVNDINSFVRSADCKFSNKNTILFRIMEINVPSSGSPTLEWNKDISYSWKKSKGQLQVIEHKHPQL